MQKYSFKTKKYKPYHPKWDTPLMVDNMDELVPCASCGRYVVYGDTLTSRAIHTEIGLGYPVCEECYNKEATQENRYKK